METQIIGIKELHRNLSKMPKKIQTGRSFIVVKNSKPVFRIEPLEKKKKYKLSDFRKFQFKSGDKNLSKKVDKILYGI